MNMNKVILIFVKMMFILMILVPVSFAEGSGEETEEEAENCDYTINRYIIADPVEIMPNIDETVMVKWSFQCDHDSRVEVYDSSGAVVRTIASAQSFTSGDNSIVWDGKIGTEPAPDDTYTIIITPMINSQFMQLQSKWKLIILNTLLY